MRYSPQVVSSLEAAIRHISAQRSAQRLTLIGYSGGGVLAMLLAERLESTQAVVTIAANLDTSAWTKHHHYSPLVGSLNPARQPPLSSNIRQFHLAGAKDVRVPAENVKVVSGLQKDADLRIYQNFDHTCCWLDIWPEILRELRKESL